MGFLEACLALNPTGYFFNEQGWGDELELKSKNPGTWSGNVRGRRGPSFGSARFINNTSSTQLVNYQNLTAWNVTTPSTFAGWVRVNTAASGGYNVVFARGLSPDSFTDRTFNLYVSGMNPQFRIFRGGNAYLSSGATTLETGVWYMISGRYVQGSTVQVHLNGIADGPITTPTNFAINNPNTRTLRIGADGTSTAGAVNTDYEVGPCVYWSGTLLTETEMRGLYAAGMAG